MNNFPQENEYICKRLNIFFFTTPKKGKQKINKNQ